MCNRTAGHVWIRGDFNFPGYNWAQKLIKSSCSQPELTRTFLDIIDDNGLTQVVKEPTFYENTLDLFLVSNPSIVYSYNTQVIPGISNDGHHAVYVELDVSLTRRNKKPQRVHSFKKAVLKGLKTHMKAAGNDIISYTTEETPVDHILHKFTKAIEEGMNKYIPTRMTKIKERSLWITSDIKRLLWKTMKLFEKQKGSAYASRASQHYRSLKAFIQKSIWKAYWRYI